MDSILTLTVEGVDYSFTNPTFEWDNKLKELYIIDTERNQKHIFKFLNEENLNMCSLKGLGLENSNSCNV